MCPWSLKKNWCCLLRQRGQPLPLPKISQILWTACGCNIHSSEGTLLRDSMSAPWFNTPGTCDALNERSLTCAHSKISKRHFEVSLPWQFIWDTTVMLSEQTGTWCSIRSGKKVWRPRHTAVISRQLMCSRPSASDQEPKAGLPSHRAPQPVLDAFVETTFLLRIMPIVTPCLNHCGSFQGARAVTQAWLTLMRRHPWCHAWGGICGFSQYWRGIMRSRPNCSTGDAEAMRPSILWNVLRGREALILKEATSCCMASARSGTTIALMWTESKTAPRNEARWLGDSELLAKLTLRPRHSKWLRREGPVGY